MRALMVAPEPFFQPRGTPFSVYYRALVLSELGVEIDLLCYGQGQDVEIPGVRILRSPSLHAFGPVRAGPSLLKLVLDVPLAVRTYWRALLGRYDFVHVHEEAVFFSLLVPLLGPKLVYDMHSSLAQQLVAYRWDRYPLLVWLFEVLERASLRRAHAVITISPALAELALTQVRSPGRHFLIENSIFDPVRLVPTANRSNASRWLRELPEGRTVVAYAGTLERYQGVDLLIRAVAVARRTDPQLFLLVIGGASDQIVGLRSVAVGCGMDEHCLFTGTLDQQATTELLSRAQVLTSPRVGGINTPLKVYQLLASGKPVVATRISSHTQVLDDETCILTDPSPEAFADGLLRAVRDSEESHRRIQAALELYRSKYSRSIYESKLRALLETLDR